MRDGGSRSQCNSCCWSVRLIAKRLTYVGHVYEANCYSNQVCHIYLATDFERSIQQLDDEEEGLVTKCISIEEFEAMLVSGEIKDGATICAYGLAKLKKLIG